MYVLNLKERMLTEVDTEDPLLFSLNEMLKGDGTYIAGGYILYGRRLRVLPVPFEGEPLLVIGEGEGIGVDLEEVKVYEGEFDEDWLIKKGEIGIYKGIGYEGVPLSLIGKEVKHTFELPENIPFLNWQSIYMNEEERKEMREEFKEVLKKYPRVIPPDQYIALTTLTGINDYHHFLDVYQTLLSKGVNPTHRGFFTAIEMELHEGGIKDPEMTFFTEIDPERNAAFVKNFEGIVEDPEYGVFLRLKEGTDIPPLEENPYIFMNAPLTLPFPPEEYAKRLEEIYHLLEGNDNFELFVILLKLLNIRRKAYLMPPEGRASHLIEKYTKKDAVEWFLGIKEELDRYLPTIDSLRHE